MEPRKERFSIRKFSVGVASVLIGFFFMGMGQGQTVRADTQNDVKVEQPSSTQTDDAKSEVITDQSTSDATSTIKADSVTTGANDDKVATADTTDVPVEDPTSVPEGTVKGSQVKQDNQLSVTEGTKQAQDAVKQASTTPSNGNQGEQTHADSQGTGNVDKTPADGTTLNEKAGKNTSSVKIISPARSAREDAKSEVKSDTAMIDKVKPGVKTNVPTLTAAEIQNQFNDLENKLEAGILSEDDAAKVTEDLFSKLTPAQRASLSIISFGAEPEVPNYANVHDWNGFINAISNKSIKTINLETTIDVNGSVPGTSAGTTFGWNGALTLSGENIARELTINGNGNALNFGRYSLMFENANQNDGSGWNITFKDISINAGQTQSSALTNYMNGVLSPISFKDVNKENQSKDVVTFDSVTADVSTRPVISGASYQNEALLNAKLNETYTLNFKGNNTITNAGYQGSITSPDDGNAVEAGYINFLNGKTTINMTQTGDSSHNYGGNAVRAVQNGTSINIENGANVTITGGKNVRGVYAGADKLTGALDGLVKVDGNLTENLGAGHSTAINAGNLTVGSTGKIDVTTAQDNNRGLVGNATFNGNHYGVIALGVGHLQGTYSSAKNTLTDNGSIKINRIVTDKLSTPLIAFGGGGVTGNYELTVNNGATLDLQDAADQESSDHAGMIVMFGTSSTDKINFNNPAYVNLQRTAGKGSSLDDVTGNFITTQGTNNNVNITGTIPVAQWSKGNTDKTPSFGWSINDLKTMSNWGTNSYTFTPSGKTVPQAGRGEAKLLNSNGTVIMGANQAGKDSFKFDNGTTVPGTPSYTNKGEYYAPYLSSYLNNFSWWMPQRLVIGTKVFNDSNIKIKDADKYQPEVQTINGNTSQILKDLQARTGIKDLITEDDNTIPLPSDATVAWYNSATDGTTWTKVMGNYPAPTNPTGNLRTSDKHAWAKITYADGSIDFANIPLNITAPDTTKDSSKYPVHYDGIEAKRPTDNSSVVKNSSPKITSGMPSGTIINYQTDYTRSNTGIAVNPTTGDVTVTVTKDNSSWYVQHSCKDQLRR